MDDIAILQGFRLCADLSKRELEQMAKIAVLEEHEADYHVIEENEVASTLYLVESGMVAVKMKSRGGHEVLIDELGPGELFGWSAVLNDQTFTAAVSTIEESTLIAFDGEALRRLFKKDQGIGFQVVNNIAAVVSSRLEHLRSRLADEPFAPEWLSSPAQVGTVGPPSMGARSEMRNMACPSCATANHPFAVVNETEQYRCRNCGMVYYSPAGCETG
jgi:CRP/FNR family cyclic AMP-dependent transcriptional regulator